jgi:hypothetical protein
VPELERKSVSGRALALYSALLATMLVALAFVAYRELLHYERRALRHVPTGATLVVRVDLEQLSLFEPVRKHLLSLVDRVALGTDGDLAAQDAHSGRLARLRKDAGLNLGLDLRELVFANLADGDGWVLAAGGLFSDADLIERVASVLAAEPGARLRREGALLLIGAGNLTLGRAADGILLLGSSPQALERAMLPSGPQPTIGQDGAASFFATSLGPQDDTTALERIRGRLDYGDPFTLTLEVEHAASAALDPRRALERWLHVDTSSFTPSVDWGGERALLARAEFAATSPTLTRVTTTWDHAEVDRTCRSLAAWLEAGAAHLGPLAQ